MASAVDQVICFHLYAVLGEDHVYPVFLNGAVVGHQSGLDTASKKRCTAVGR